VTIQIPKWLLWGLAGVLVIGGIAAGAYLLGKSSDESEGDPGSPVTGEEAVAPPRCSVGEARKAVLETDFEAYVRELGAVQPGEPLFKRFGYVLADLTCREFTGDQVDEMVVQLACCTGGSPSPWAIFVAEGGKWRLAFHREDIQAVLSVEGDEIVEKSPAYAAGDPTCCPTTFRFGRVSWRGDEFVFESGEGSANRTIKAGTRGVTRVGNFDPRVGSPLDAVEAFGPPSIVAPNDELCVNEWRDLGLLINFANLGGADPCSADGRVGTIELKDVFAEHAGWETEQGVRVGMNAKELRDVYPDAQPASYPGLGDVLVLIEGPTVIGEGGTYPVLGARVVDERVSELQLSVGAAGE
jgi:hypothetical protein